MGQGKIYKCEYTAKQTETQFELPSIEDAIGNLVDYLKSIGGSLYNLFTKDKSINS